MSALVGYGSSDEEDDIQPEKPAKIARLDVDDHDVQNNNANVSTPSAPIKTTSSSIEEQRAAIEPPQTSNLGHAAPGPFISDGTELSTRNTTPSASLSPYSSLRQRIQELTMPTVPNFDIPESPSPPKTNSEEAAVLAASTKKFERFLELKKQGVHFNDRLQKSAALRNPSLLPKLMDFAGIELEASYGSTLPVELAVPTKWPDECYVEELVKTNDRLEEKRKEGREKVDFVPAAAVKSASSSAVSTPKERGAADRHRKRSRFDQK